VKDRPVIDVSRLPAYAFGHRSLLWWATMGIIVIEGSMFAILIVSYFYLKTRAPEWPPNTQPPSLVYGTINTIVLLASLAPNYIYKKAAEREELRKVQIWLLISIVFAVAFTAIRAFEFGALKCSWDTNAYGSIVWTLLGFHTTHLVTDLLDTIVLTALIITKPVEGKRFVDVSENAFYWYFVVLVWVPIYAVIYLVPRLG
jgi:cytochrome c oxidase subunit III